MGCRDCSTCTKPGFARAGQSFALGSMHVMTLGVSFMVKRGTMRHCPQCNHLLSNHQRRADGSFKD